MTTQKLTGLVKSFSVAIAIILIWRGAWYILDIVDYYFFGGSHILTAIGGIAVGVAILYFPDHNLKELSRL